MDSGLFFADLSWFAGPGLEFEYLSLLPPKPPRRRAYVIDGYIEDNTVEATPDSGCDGNVISEAFANRSGFTIDRESIKKYRLPSGQVMRTIGEVKLPWRFSSDSEARLLTFSVMSTLIHDVVLGNAFLKAEKIFTTFRSLLRTVLLPLSKPPSVNLLCSLDSELSTLRGCVDGNYVDALPDTGSQVNLTSMSYARKCGYTIRQEPVDCIRLELADGSQVDTCGRVADAQWRYGDEPRQYSCDFYVLDTAHFELLLGADFLFDTDAYNRYGHCFNDREQSSVLDDTSRYGHRVYHQFSLIRQICKGDGLFSSLRPNRRQRRRDHSTQNHEDEEVLRELQRRDAVDEHIEALPDGEQAAAREAEQARRQQWALNRTSSNLRAGDTPS